MKPEIKFFIFIFFLIFSQLSIYCSKDPIREDMIEDVDSPPNNQIIDAAQSKVVVFDLSYSQKSIPSARLCFSNKQCFNFIIDNNTLESWVRDIKCNNSSGREFYDSILSASFHETGSYNL